MPRESVAWRWGVHSRRLDPDAVEPGAATRMRAKLFHFWPADRPNEPQVDRNPRKILCQQGLSSDVEPLTFRTEEELARSDQQVVEAVITIEREIHRTGTLRCAFSAGSRVEQEMGIAGLDPAFGERHLMLATLHQGERCLRRCRPDGDGESRGRERCSNRFREPDLIHSIACL